MRLVRVGRIDESTFPFRRSTMYRWASTGRFPEIFVRPEGSQSLFLDMDAFEKYVVEPGRSQGPFRIPNRRRSAK